MIRTERLLKRLDGQKVLENLNLTVKRGSIYGLIGSNGAGKSTLLNVLAGVYKPDGGTAKICGEDIFENVGVKGKTAYISDDPFYFNGATVDEMASYLNSVYKSFSMEKYKSVAGVFPINTSKRISSFSKGMKRQVSFILALAQQPEILLCDESFDGLDPVIRKLVKRLFVNEVAENGMTIVISSHNLREMENLCDTIGILHDNRIVVEKSISDIKETLHRYQAAYKPMIDIDMLKDKLDILTSSMRGSILELTVRGDREKISAVLESYAPLLIDEIELTLEDIFICEMEVSGYDFSKILL